MIIDITVTKMTNAWTGARSAVTIDSTAYRPIPGQVNATSTSMAPAIRKLNDWPLNVMMGINALFRAYLKKMSRLGNPLAIAAFM